MLIIEDDSERSRVTSSRLSAKSPRVRPLPATAREGLGSRFDGGYDVSSSIANAAEARRLMVIGRGCGERQRDPGAHSPLPLGAGRRPGRGLRAGVRRLSCPTPIPSPNLWRGVRRCWRDAIPPGRRKPSTGSPISNSTGCPIGWFLARGDRVAAAEFQAARIPDEHAIKSLPDPAPWKTSGTITSLPSGISSSAYLRLRLPTQDSTMVPRQAAAAYGARGQDT